MTREPVKSAVRALEILKLFSIERRPLNQKEIIKRLGYPQSSATFLLKSMVHTGYLSFERGGRTYLPAPEVYRLGEWLEDFGYEHLFRRGVMTELLDELRTRSGETVSLATQNDIFVQWHRILLSDLPDNLHTSEGSSLPLTWSPFGCMLLSQQQVHHIDRIVRLINVRETDPNRRLNVDQTVAKLGNVREVGYCCMRSPKYIGATAIATLLPVKVAGRDVAVGIGGRSEQIECRQDRLTELLFKTIDSYADELGEAFGEDVTSRPLAAGMPQERSAAVA